MISQKLLKRQAAGKPIRVAWVGAGRMNTGAICQTAMMKGMSNSVICDLRVDAAARAYEINGHKQKDILISDNVSAINDALRAGKPVITQNSHLLPELEVDCVVEGTGVPEVGAETALRSIQGGKHIIMLNVETDVVIGPILHQMAERAGVIYSVSSGDEPGLITELVDRWGGLGFEIVAVGKTPASLGKMDRYATPDTIAADAKALNVNPHFLVTFRDATKTSIEMSCIANATGLVPDLRGMHGPVAGIRDMARLFCLKEEGGILNRRGVVDYARPLLLPDGKVDYVNSVTPGVFVVVRVTHPQIQQDLTYFDVVRSGEYFTFYMPYHLVTNEIPLSIVWAVEDHEPTVVPHHGLLAECIGAAKSDLKAGTSLDAGGGYTVYALNDLASVAKKEGCVPFGLLNGAKLLRDVKKDQVITQEMVSLKTDTTLYYLRQLQDTLISPTEVSRG
jgi:predicted homoserine dehydrogenase-like protein